METLSRQVKRAIQREEIARATRQINEIHPSGANRRARRAHENDNQSGKTYHNRRKQTKGRKIQIAMTLLDKKGHIIKGVIKHLTVINGKTVIKPTIHGDEYKKIAEKLSKVAKVLKTDIRHIPGNPNINGIMANGNKQTKE